MLRQFTKDLGRYRKGDVRDYPAPTWRGIAGRAKLDSFSKPVTMAPDALVGAVRDGAGLAGANSKEAR